MVIKLTPSPAFDGLTEVKEDQVTTKLILAMLDQRESARLAAPTTSLPSLMFAGGESNELENASSMVRLGHLISFAVWVVGSNSEESLVSRRSPTPRLKSS